MSTQVKHRRGTNAEVEAFTGAEAEITYDTTNKRLSAHDGSTVGGNVIPNYKDAQNQSFTYAAGTLSTGVYAVTLGKSPGAYVTGLQFTIVPGSNNAGACDVNVNGMGAKDINKDNGSGTLVELSADDMRANIPYDLFYNGTKFILRAGGSSGTTPTKQVFTSSGTWTKPSGCRKIRVRVIGGGGGGGDDNGTNPGTTSFGTHVDAGPGGFGESAGVSGGASNTAIGGTAGAGGPTYSGDENHTGQAGGWASVVVGSGHIAGLGGVIWGQYGRGGNGTQLYNIYARSGGGSGGMSVKDIDATSLSTETVTIGAGGVGQSSTGNPGAVIVEEFY